MAGSLPVAFTRRLCCGGFARGGFAHVGAVGGVGRVGYVGRAGWYRGVGVVGVGAAALGGAAIGAAAASASITRTDIRTRTRRHLPAATTRIRLATERSDPGEDRNEGRALLFGDARRTPQV